MSDSVTSAPVCDSHSSFCRLNTNSKGSNRPTSSSEHKSLFQLPQNLHPRDAEGLGKRRPDCVPVPPAIVSRLRKPCIIAQQRRVRTRGVSECATNGILQHASKRYIVLIYVCLGACLLVTSVSLVAKTLQKMDLTAG